MADKPPALLLTEYLKNFGIEHDVAKWLVDNHVPERITMQIENFKETNKRMGATGKPMKGVGWLVSAIKEDYRLPEGDEKFLKYVSLFTVSRFLPGGEDGFMQDEPEIVRYGEGGTSHLFFKGKFRRMFIPFAKVESLRDLEMRCNYVRIGDKGGTVEVHDTGRRAIFLKGIKQGRVQRRK